MSGHFEAGEGEIREEDDQGKELEKLMPRE